MNLTGSQRLSRCALGLGVVLALSGCGAGAAKVDKATQEQVAPSLAGMPEPKVTGDGVFGAPDDKAMLLGFHGQAARLTDASHQWSSKECDALGDDLAQVGSPNEVMAAMGRVKEPYLQMLWWNERRAVGQAVAACAGNRITKKDLIGKAGQAAALVQIRLDKLEVSR